MATWQFDFHVVPEGGVANFFGTTPLVIDAEAFVDHNWWAEYRSLAELETDISSVAPRLTSWSSEIERWGTEDGDRIDVVRSGAEVCDVLVRVDARRISQTFLADIVKLARKHHLLLRLSDGRIVKPSIGKLLSEIRLSSAFRFCEDPRVFLESLDAATRRDPTD
jgi:hypothetical protein